MESLGHMLRMCLTFKNILFFRAVLGLQQNSAQSTEISYTSHSPTCLQPRPPSRLTTVVHL